MFFIFVFVFLALQCLYTTELCVLSFIDINKSVFSFSLVNFPLDFPVDCSQTPLKHDMRTKRLYNFSEAQTFLPEGIGIGFFLLPHSSFLGSKNVSV